MYQVLYRKWRPRTFSDVYGQPQVTQTLLGELKSGRVAHAYLFVGTRGTGKTTCAKILARAVNCLHPVDGDPCNECEICRGIENESITDVVEMDAASNNGVDDIRSLRDKVNFTPSSCKYLVYIIDEVHMLSPSAFNALLKTLEEPPPYVIFILATTEAHKIPATILSRCQRLNFKRIDPEEISRRLSFIAGEEGAELDDKASALIARLADGGMRDAVSLLDQCLSHSREITEEVVTSVAGLAGTEHVFELSRMLRAGDCAGMMELLSSLHSESKDMLRLCGELISHFRSLMIINTVKQPEKLLVVTSSGLEQLKTDAAAYSLGETITVLDSLQSALERMGRGAGSRTELEMCLIKTSRKINAAASGDLEARVAALEKKLREGVLVRETAARQAERPCAPIPKDKTAELSDRATPFEQWPQVLALLEQKECHALFAALNGSHAYVCDDYLLVDCNEFCASLLRQSSTKDSLREAISEVCQRSYRFGPYRPSSARAQDTKAPLDALRKRIEQSEYSGSD